MKAAAGLIYGVVVLVLVLLYLIWRGSATGTEGFASGGYEFAMVYAPWCGHCKTTLPLFEEFANASPMTVNGKEVAIKKIDGDADKAAAEKLGVEGFPTFVMIMPDGSVTKHEGGRDADSWKAFIQNTVK
jgi:thiol-disulfide isomerase/thioredoxin